MLRPAASVSSRWRLRRVVSPPPGVTPWALASMEPRNSPLEMAGDRAVADRLRAAAEAAATSPVNSRRFEIIQLASPRQ